MAAIPKVIGFSDEVMGTWLQYPKSLIGAKRSLVPYSAHFVHEV